MDLGKLKEEYWKVIRRTRKSGRISKSVIEKEGVYWSQFSEDIVCAALRVHIDRYPTYKEHYTRGIMRNMAVQKQKTGKVGKSNQFNEFKENEYDFEKLEEEILSN